MLTENSFVQVENALRRSHHLRNSPYHMDSFYGSQEMEDGTQEILWRSPTLARPASQQPDEAEMAQHEGAPALDLLALVSLCSERFQASRTRFAELLVFSPTADHRNAEHHIQLAYSLAFAFSTCLRADTTPSESRGACLRRVHLGVADCTFDHCISDMRSRPIADRVQEQLGHEISNLTSAD